MSCKLESFLSSRSKHLVVQAGWGRSARPPSWSTSTIKFPRHECVCPHMRSNVGAFVQEILWPQSFNVLFSSSVFLFNNEARACARWNKEGMKFVALTLKKKKTFARQTCWNLLSNYSSIYKTQLFSGLWFDRKGSRWGRNACEASQFFPVLFCGDNFISGARRGEESPRAGAPHFTKFFCGWKERIKEAKGEQTSSHEPDADRRS